MTAAPLVKVSRGLALRPSESPSSLERLIGCSLSWAFTSGYASNWHPLTWISHMLDYQLFGLNPGAHHLMNVLLHTANTLLLFILLNNLTGAIWRSAFVAALFAWHPLHVESVAWASERKDVLSAFFWMLTLIAYARYTKSDTRRTAVKNGLLSPFYWLALIFFACGLMSKPMVVTLPFVLLLPSGSDRRLSRMARPSPGMMKSNSARVTSDGGVPAVSVEALSAGRSRFLHKRFILCDRLDAAHPAQSRYKRGPLLPLE